MTRHDFYEAVADLGVDASWVQLDASLFVSDVYAMRHEADGWHSYFAERGTRQSERVHGTEAEALQALLQLIRDDAAADSRIGHT